MFESANKVVMETDFVVTYSREHSHLVSTANTN